MRYFRRDLPTNALCPTFLYYRPRPVLWSRQLSQIMTGMMTDHRIPNDTLDNDHNAIGGRITEQTKYALREII